MRKESAFQADVIRDLKRRFPGCIVMKNDPNYIQGIPDLTVLYGKRWATLECKRSKKERHRPNQDYYVETMNKLSYSSFIYPENREKIFDELEQAFKPRRQPRVSKREQGVVAEQDK